MVKGRWVKKKTTCRLRVRSPKEFDSRSFRVKKVGKKRKKTRLVVGCPKGEWRPRAKRCRVGTRVQSVIKPIKKKGRACPYKIKPYMKR